MTAKSGSESVDHRYIDQLETGQIQVPGATLAARLAIALGATIALVRGQSVLEPRTELSDG